MKMTRRFSLTHLFLLSLLGYLILPIWFPLIPRYQEALADIVTFTPTLLAGLAYAGLVTGLFLLCWLAYRRIKADKPTHRLQHILLSSFLLGLPLLLVYPINANDVFRYFMRGRITVVHHSNPFTQSPSEFADDPYLHLTGEWVDATSPYGPLWESIDALVVWLTQSDLLLALVSFKLIGLLAHIGCGWLLYQILAQRPENERLATTLVWCWNPALLFMFVIDAHNDAVMLLTLLLGILVLTKWQRSVLGLGLMWLAPLIKIIGVIAIPFYFLSIVRRLPSTRQRLSFTMQVALVCLGLSVIAFAPFGSPQAMLVRLLNESQAGGGFSLVAMIVLVMRDWMGVDVGNLRLLVRGATILGGLGGVWFLWLAWRGRGAERVSAETTFLYLLTAFKYRIWYSTWIYPFALLDTDPRRHHVAFLFLLTSQLSVVLYGHMWRHILLNSNTLTHVIAVPFVFALPLIIAYWLRNQAQNNLPREREVDSSPTGGG